MIIIYIQIIILYSILLNVIFAPLNTLDLYFILSLQKFQFLTWQQSIYYNKQENKMKHNEQKQKNGDLTPNHTRKLGNKQFAMYLKSQPKLSTLSYNIQKYLSTYQPFYYNAFLNHIKGRDLDTLQKSLSQQYSKLLQGKSFLQRINGAIFSRNKCLDKIKRDLSKVQVVLTMFKKSYFRKSNEKDNIYIEYTGQQGYTTVQIDQTIQGSIKLINNLFLDMSRFRNMTIYIIETIHRWRVQIQQWMDKCQNHSRIDFYIKNQNEENGLPIRFYDVVKDDTDFIWISKLSQHIWMQFKNDPLLIRNVVNVSQRQTKQILQKYFVQMLYPNEEEIIDKTIKALDMLTHIYKPKQINLYEEQQKLIENYLALQRKKNQQIGLQDEFNNDDAQALALLAKSNIRVNKSRMKKSQSQSKVSVKKQFRAQIQYDNKKWQQGNPPIQSPYLTKSQVKNKSKSPKTQGRENPRGWIFGKQLKKPATDRIRQIVKKHEVQMNYLKNHKGIIKPFNIVNLPEKKSIALAYLSQKNNLPLKNQNGWVFSQNQRGSKKYKKNRIGFNSEDQNDSKAHQSDDANQKLDNEKRRNRMHQSLVKMNSIIQQDPNEHQLDHDSPKNKQTNRFNKHQLIQNLKKNLTLPKKLKQTKNKDITNNQQQLKIQKTPIKKQYKKQQNLGKKLVESGIKINTIFNNLNQQNQIKQAQIQVQQEQTPLNFKQFFEVFRADTKQKSVKDSRTSNILGKSNLKNIQPKKVQSKQIKEGASSSIRKILSKNKSQSEKKIKLLPYYNQSKNKKNKVQKSINKQKSKQKSQNSFKSYNKVNLSRHQISNQITKNQQTNKIGAIIADSKQFINLKTKQITKDMIIKYIKHICEHIPVSSKSFTNYHTQAYLQNLVRLLSDSIVNSLIFDIQAEKEGKIGQAIVIEALSSTLKMRYNIQFINVYKFQLLVGSVCKIAQQLLSTSPCQQVVFKLVEDKADPVSTHFIQLIDNSLKIKAQKFSYFHILQKKILGLTNQDLHERVYIFQAKSRNIIKEAIMQRYSGNWRKRVAGSSYKSLVFNTTCLALTSNFKLRSENLNKATIQIYKQESIGILYVILLHKIMTKYHLKQLKIASLSINDTDQTTGLVKKSPFLRSIFYGLHQIIKKSSDQSKGSNVLGWIKNSITQFNSMTDLLNYLSYKQYDQVFKFDFLIQSRFILNHELSLSELNLSASLDFVLQNSANMLILNNYHNFKVEQLSRTSKSDHNSSIDQLSGIKGYLLPTTEDNLKLFFMSAKQYLNCSDSLDLYSYLQLVFKESFKKQRHDLKQLVIPNLTKRKNKINTVKMYDGFLRLFPEREFYSASNLSVHNLWENYYPNGVISMPDPDAIIIQYPIIVGFYDSVIQLPIVSYILKQQKSQVK